jgi:hypothetical protein
MIPSKRGNMKPVWCMVGFLCLGKMTFGGENAAVHSSPTPSTENFGAGWSFDLNSAYTFGSRIQKAANLGSQAEYRYEIEALRNLRITGDYYLQLGIDYERFDFSRSNAVFPYSFTSFNAEVNFSYWSGDDFYPVVKIEPGIYYTRDHVTRNSFDVPLSLTPGFKVSENLYLIGDGYRNGPTRDRRTNNAIIEYEEERAGPGASFTLRKGIEFEAIAGWTFQRTYDYVRSGPDYYSKGAPYFRVELSLDLF